MDSGDMTTYASDALADRLHSALLRALWDICNREIMFLRVVQITGRMSFDVDNNQVLDININKLINRSVPHTNNLGGDPYSGARQRENHQGDGYFGPDYSEQPTEISSTTVADGQGTSRDVHPYKGPRSRVPPATVCHGTARSLRATEAAKDRADVLTNTLPTTGIQRRDENLSSDSLNQESRPLHVTTDVGSPECLKMVALPKQTDPRPLDRPSYERPGNGEKAAVEKMSKSDVGVRDAEDSSKVTPSNTTGSSEAGSRDGRCGDPARSNIDHRDGSARICSSDHVQRIPQGTQETPPSNGELQNSKGGVSFRPISSNNDDRAYGLISREHCSTRPKVSPAPPVMRCDQEPHQPAVEEVTQKRTNQKLCCGKCNFSTDHSGHFREHQSRHFGPRPHHCGGCSRSFVRLEDYRRHVELHNRRFECVVCRVLFSSRANLRSHLKKLHDLKLSYFQCDVCHKNMPSSSDLEKHIAQKHNHQCDLCEEVFPWQKDLRQHQETAHKDRAFRCRVCGRQCPSRSALSKHLSRHTSKGYTCDVCGKTFTAQSTLYHHKRGLHSQVKPYHCEQCGASFSFHHSMKLHQLWHAGRRPYQCQLCNKSYLTNTHLKAHMKAIHQASKDFRCNICHKEFPYENSLRMHILLHTDTRPFTCSRCGKGFVSNGALRVHLKSHEAAGKMFDCEICSKGYKSEALLRVHMRRHTGEGARFMCDICGNRFMYKSNLEAHSKVHSERRDFKCEECGKAFRTYATLYSHKLVHRPETPFTCEVCGKGFKSKDRMLSHEKRHLRLKPFGCDLCGRCFPDKGGLTKHTKTVHLKPKRFACPSCGKTSSRADNLRVHMKIHGDPELLKLPFAALIKDDGVSTGADHPPATAKSTDTDRPPQSHSVSTEPHERDQSQMILTPSVNRGRDQYSETPTYTELEPSSRARQLTDRGQYNISTGHRSPTSQPHYQELTPHRPDVAMGPILPVPLIPPGQPGGPPFLAPPAPPATPAPLAPHLWPLPMHVYAGPSTADETTNLDPYNSSRACNHGKTTTEEEQY